MTEAALIEGYKKDFFRKTGKSLKVRLCTRWESICELPCQLELDTVLTMILDATGWTYDQVFARYQTAVSVFRRGLVYFILTNNEFALLKLARRTDRDHTTIINARRRFQQQLDEEPLTSKILIEVMDYIKSNYQHYLPQASS